MTVKQDDAPANKTIMLGYYVVFVFMKSLAITDIADQSIYCRVMSLLKIICICRISCFNGWRVFVVHRDERLAYERTEREKAMARVRAALDSLAQRVNAGKLKAPEKIGAAAARTLAPNHGYRYYDWKLEHGRFTYFEHPVSLRREKSLEGKYLIQTEEQSLSALEAVAVHKELSEVERAFARLKDVIEMRPIFHQKASRVQAHVFAASLAFLLDRAMEKKLKSAGLDVSSREAWQVLKTVRVVEVGFGDDRTTRSVTQGSGRAAKILKILELKNLDPDTRKTGERAA
jgi:transposase